MRYLLGEAFLNVRHGGVVSFLAMCIVALTAILFAALTAVGNAVQGEVRTLEETPALVVFPSDELSEAKVQRLDALIREMEPVQATIYVSKAEAFARARRMFGEKGRLLLQGFEEENPLPRSIEVYVRPEDRTPEVIRSLAAELRNLDGVEAITYQERQMVLLQRIRGVVYGVGGLIIVIAIVVVALSTLLTVYSRREELIILQLVGATYSFIRIPLLLQGCVQGFLGCVVGLGLAYLFFQLYGSTLGLSVFLTPEQIAAMVGGAVLVGATGGMIPLRKRIRLLQS